MRHAFHAALVAVLWLTAAAWGADAKGPVKVFILAGQSNMEGKAKVALLEYQANQPATAERFKHLRKDGKWMERDDVWIKFLDRKGKLTVGYGSPNCIGPELEFGNVVGGKYEEPVLLIKTAWGGRSLYRDFRSPSAGFPPAEALEKMLEQARKKKPETKMEEIKATFGTTYRAMLEEVAATLADLKTLFPEYDGRGYELAGFVWFQGWNDMISDEATAEYAVNIAHFIRDVRRDLKSPNLPFVIGQMGVDGMNPNDKIKKFKEAQAAAAALPEFKGNVALVKTDQFWDTEAEAVFKKGWRQNMEEWNKVGSDWGFYYLGSAKTMTAIGKAMGAGDVGDKGGEVTSMANRQARLLNEAMALPAHDRAWLAEQLLESLGTAESEVNAAWAAEIESRIKSIDEGRVKLIPAEDVFRELTDRQDDGAVE